MPRASSASGDVAGRDRRDDRPMQGETANGAPTATGTTPAGPSRRRRIVVWILIVVATILGIASMAALWVDRQLLASDSWQTASEEAIADPAVRATVATYVVDRLYTNVDVAAGFEERLPPALDPLAPTIAAALREPAIQAVERLLERPRVQQTFVAASGGAHDRLMAVLEDETAFGISTGEGTVTIDLKELLTQIGQELGLSGARLAQLPPDAGVITLMESEQLKTAQDVLQAIRLLSAWLLIAVLALYAVAIALARDFRREALRNTGLAFVLLGLTALVVRRLAGDYLVDALASPATEDTSRRIWLIFTQALGGVAWAAILYGVVAIVGAVLAGPWTPAVAVRRRLAPALIAHPGVVATGVAAVYLLVVVWGGTHALRTWWGVVLLGALLALGVIALRRQVLREAAAATDPVPPVAGAGPTPPEALAVVGLAGPSDGSPPATA
jgi:hypothetical protein